MPTLLRMTSNLRDIRSPVWTYYEAHLERSDRLLTGPARLRMADASFRYPSDRKLR